MLATGVPFQGKLGSAEAVGTAGTVTALAALDLALDPYDADRVTGHRLTTGRIRELYAWLAGMPLADRQHLPGLEPGRADVIVAGACLLAESLAVLGFGAFKVFQLFNHFLIILYRENYCHFFYNSYRLQNCVLIVKLFMLIEYNQKVRKITLNKFDNQHFVGDCVDKCTIIMLKLEINKKHAW